MSDQPTFIEGFTQRFYNECVQIIHVLDNDLIYDVVKSMAAETQKPHLFVSLVNFYKMSNEEQTVYKEYYAEILEDNVYNTIFMEDNSMVDKLYKVFRFKTDRSAVEFAQDYFPQRQDFKFNNQEERWIPVQVVMPNGSIPWANYS